MKAEAEKEAADKAERERKEKELADELRKIKDELDSGKKEKAVVDKNLDKDLEDLQKKNEEAKEAETKEK